MITDDRPKGLLLAAYTDGFLLEHDVSFKSMSRHPLSGASRAQIRERLEPDFEDWLARTPLLGTDEGERLRNAPTTQEADG